MPFSFSTKIALVPSWRATSYARRMPPTAAPTTTVGSSERNRSENRSRHLLEQHWIFQYTKLLHEPIAVPPRAQPEVPVEQSAPLHERVP